MTQPYPLAWPSHRPRTPAIRRKDGKFRSAAGGARYPTAVSIPQALDRLQREIDLLGGLYPLVSSNVPTRLDGLPRAGTQKPEDPGVCVYFTLGAEPFALACDTYSDVAQNIAALAAHIEATRAISRHGVASAAESLQAFSALPPPGPAIITPRSWRQVFEVGDDFLNALSPEAARGAIRRAYRSLVHERHPDTGGSDAAMAELNAARDAALKELESR